MEDLLWSLEQESRTLQNLRKDMRVVWQDEAAHELNGRYLDPHETEDEQMLAELNEQKASLDDSTAKLASAASYARLAEEYATWVVEGLKSTEQELPIAYGNYDTYAHYNSEARAKFPVIKKLISQANSACDA
jgi:hypothetical protein